MSRRLLSPSNMFHFPTDPGPPDFVAPNRGDVYYNTTFKVLRVYDRDGWVDLDYFQPGGGAVDGEFSITYDSQTLLETALNIIGGVHGIRIPALISTSANITDLDAPLARVVKTSSYTPNILDRCGRWFEFANPAAPVVFTIPPHSVVPLAEGWYCYISRYSSTNPVTIQPAAGGNVSSANGLVVKNMGTALLMKRAGDYWTVTGDLQA